MIRKLIVIISLFLAITYNSLWAYHGDVHKKIDEYAAKPEVSQLDSVLRDQLGMDEGIDTELKGEDANGKEITQEIWRWIAYGGEAEDYGWPFNNNWLATRGFNHFHDPLKNWDEAGLDNDVAKLIYHGSYFRYPVSSILWGLKPGKQDFFWNFTGDWSWGKAREYYYIYLTGKDFEGNIVAVTEVERKSNFANCFRSLGQVLHLLQDASVPLHTRNDVHVFPLLKIPGTKFYLLGKWNYETYTKEYLKDEGEHKLDFIPDQPGDHPDPVLLTDPQPDPNYSNIVPISGLFDRNQYNEGATSPPHDNTIGLAEYSNANFLTDDTMWKYQHPRKEDTTYQEIDWLNPEEVVAEDGDTDSRIYIKFKDGIGEDIDHLAAVDYWFIDYLLYLEIEHGLLLDKLCWKDYAAKLIPRAVGYSAGLLDYFFRGEIDMVPDDEAGGYVIVNKTEEEMEGTFELYYDNNYDERIQLWQMEFTLGPFDPNNPDSGDNKSYNIHFDEPDNAKDPGKYILVFRGRLGNETDAVVGKVIKPPFYLRISIDGDYITYGRIEFQIKWWGLDGVQHTENHIIPGDREEYTSPGGTTYRYSLVAGPFYLSEIDFDKPWSFRLYRDRNDMNPDNTSLCQSWSDETFSSTGYSDDKGNWAYVFTVTSDAGSWNARQSVSYHYLTNWTFAAVYEDPEGDLLLASFSDETFFPFQDFDFYCNQCCVDGIKYWDLPEDPDYQGDQPVMLYGRGYALCYEDEISHVESKTGLTFGSTRYSIATYLDLEVTIDREDVEDNMWVPNNPMVTYYSVSRNPDNPDFKGWVYDLNLEYGIKSRTAGKTITQDSPQPMDTADIDQLFGIGHSYKYGGRKWFYGNNNWPYPNNNPYEWGWSGGRIYNKYFSERWLPILRYNSDEDRVYWEPEFLQEIRDYIHPMDIIWFGIKHYPVNVVANPSYATLMCWNPWVPFGDTGWEDAKMWQAYFLSPVTFIPDTPFDDIGPTILPADGGPMPSGELECKYDLQREVAWWVIGHQGGNYYPGQCEEPTTITEHHEAWRGVADFVY